MKNRYSLTPKGYYCINHGFREDAMHTKSHSSKPWSEMERGVINSQTTIDYKLMRDEYKPILDKCGFPSPTISLIERIKIYSKERFNYKMFDINI